MDTEKAMFDIDSEIYALVDANPGLAARYKELMGEELGSVVTLSRVPTVEDWAAAKRLAASRVR